MNLLDRAMWAVARLFPAPLHAPWLDVPHGEGPIGADWPARRGAVPSRTLLDVETLGPIGALHPDVRAFYADPAGHALSLTTRWRLGARPFAALWALAFAGRWGQLQLPLRDSAVTNAVLADPDTGRWWVRCYPDGAVFFVARFDVVEGPFVRIVFPVPGGAWVAIVRPTVRDGGLVLDEVDGRPGGPGLYLVPTGGVPRYVAAVREAIAIGPGPVGLRATHTLDVFGVRVAAFDYAIAATSPAVIPATRRRV